MTSFIRLLFSLLLLVLHAGCMSTKLHRIQEPPDGFSYTGKKPGKIKIYMKDGSLYILDDFLYDENKKQVNGSGYKYDINRRMIVESDKELNYPVIKFFEICQDDIAIIESNKIKGHGGNLAAIIIPGLPYAAFSIYCITNPKACFGSCPTFYSKKDGEWKLSAEGFSSSILPVFEEQDIDKLYFAERDNNELRIRLTNEAFETHLIRYAKILAFPVKNNEKVFYSSIGKFVLTDNTILPEYCKGKEGDCLEEVSFIDRKERYSLCDSKNLNKKEELILSFEASDISSPGLIISSRQTLLTTYLFYQAMAFSGRYYAQFAASLENGNERLKSRFHKIWNKLGGIEVFVQLKNGQWKRMDTIMESGPIASDYHLVKLPAGLKDRINLKLRMTKGLWRINYIALSDIKEVVHPIELQPYCALKNDLKSNMALDQLTDTTNYLITYPGDNFQLNYKLPDDLDYDFFLDTKGYYLEWMREEWLKEEDLGKIKLLFGLPGIYFRRITKDFKKLEPTMEEAFWNSRYEIQ